MDVSSFAWGAFEAGKAGPARGRSLHPAEGHGLGFHRDPAHLVAVVGQLLLVTQKGMVEGRAADRFDLGEAQLKAGAAVFPDPGPKGRVFAHGFTLPSARTP